MRDVCSLVLWCTITWQIKKEAKFKMGAAPSYICHVRGRASLAHGLCQSLTLVGQSAREEGSKGFILPCVCVLTSIRR